MRIAWESEYIIYFFFSSRRRHTSCGRDWSSDVCSSDLMGETFKELAESGKSLTRLPRREFSRRRVLEAIDEAFQLIGGVPRLAIWAHVNPTEFYKLWGKTIPAASQMEIMGHMTHVIRPALP